MRSQRSDNKRVWRNWQTRQAQNLVTRSGRGSSSLPARTICPTSDGSVLSEGAGRGSVAQLGERLREAQEAGGSIPSWTTNDVIVVLRVWRNWQTRQLERLVTGIRSWEFKSPRPHTYTSSKGGC